jgi:hypothetical protein
MVEQIRNLPPEVILKAASRCDGHTIFKPEAFTNDGLPEDVVSYITHTYKSDGSPKGTIFVDGQAVKDLKGVYGLDLLRLLASVLNVTYQSAIGRGFEAQNIQHALRQQLLKSSPDGRRSG